MSIVNEHGWSIEQLETLRDIVHRLEQLESLMPGLVRTTGNAGGAGSAGAGNQYVELTVAGITYKVLHDGTV